MTAKPRTLSVLVPVYNESRTLATIVSQVLAVEAEVQLELELVLVDDGSVDGSWEIMQGLAEDERRVRAFRHHVNRGKGAAIRTAIQHMTGDIAIVQDADLEYDPRDFHRVIGPIVEGRADAVFGSRFAASEVRRVLFFWHSLGNKLLTLLFNVFNDLNLTDMETCYKAVRADVLRELRLESERFGIEPEISTRLAQWGARIYEVPVSYHGRTYAEGKHIGWRDGVQALWLIVKFRFLDTEYSNTGEASEASLGQAKSYARWVLDVMQVDLTGRVLEVEAGTGNYTRLLLGAAELIVADSSPRRLAALRRRFGRSPHVRMIEGTPTSDWFDVRDVDVVMSFNGLATAADPLGWLSELRASMNRGGRLHLLVPAHPGLSTRLDRSFTSRKRYTLAEIEALLRDAGFSSSRVREFNRLGAAAWRLSGFVGITGIGPWQARMFGLSVPIARRLERFIPMSGLSFIIEATAGDDDIAR